METPTLQNNLAFWEFQRWQFEEEYIYWLEAGYRTRNYFEIDLIDPEEFWWMRIHFMDLDNVDFFHEIILSKN